MSCEQGLPEVQYAFFCREVIEVENGEMTFQNVAHEVFVPRPKDIIISFVMRLLNVPKGAHSVRINCLIPPTQLLTRDIDISSEVKGNHLITQEVKLPVATSNTYIFTILFDSAPIKRLRLPVKLLSEIH